MATPRPPSARRSRAARSVHPHVEDRHDRDRSGGPIHDAALEESLRRLRTDHVDVYFNHAVNDVGALKNPEWQAFVADAKQQGKIRFAGMSGHAGRLIECLDYALDHDLVDVILVAYNFGQDPTFYERFDARLRHRRGPAGAAARARARRRTRTSACSTMKTLMGARLNDMRPYETGGATFAQAAFRWVLSNPDVDGVVISMPSRAARRRVPRRVRRAGAVAPATCRCSAATRACRRPRYCRHGCGAPASEPARRRADRRGAAHAHVRARLRRRRARAERVRAARRRRGRAASRARPSRARARVRTASPPRCWPRTRTGCLREDRARRISCYGWRCPSRSYHSWSSWQPLRWKSPATRSSVPGYAVVVSPSSPLASRCWILRDRGQSAQRRTSHGFSVPTSASSLW